MVAQWVPRVRLWLSGRPLDPQALRSGWQYWLPTRAGARKWIRKIGTYVLAQKAVRASRQRLGAPMHLAIFYGFLAMFVATTLLSAATFSPVNWHRGTYYLAYEATFDTMGLFLLVGLSVALWRRMKEARLGRRAVAGLKGDFGGQVEQNRRHPLSHAPSDFWALCLLLALTLNGYWVEAARISANPQPWDHWSYVGYAWAQLQGPLTPIQYKSIWWFHALLALTFFAVLPQLRLRHIINAIFSTAGAPDRAMGKLRTIPLEEVEQTEQVGVKLAKDYSRWHLMSLDACMECGRCTEVCPAWKVGKRLNPKQVVLDIRGAMGTDQHLAERVSEEALWQCTTCHACVEACPVLIRHVDLITDARRNLVSEGALSGSAAVMLRQTASTSHAWGAPSSNREEWMQGLDIPLCRDGVTFEYLFWVGCAGATDPGAVKTTKAVASLLRQAGVSFACLGKDEACTGDPARRIGEEFLFQEKAGTNVSVFQRYGVKKVVTACPHCFNTLKNEYGDFGPSLEVWHHSQLLASLVDVGKLKAAPAADAVLHDPCYLGRVNAESEAPRKLLSGVANPEHHSQKTLCCGAGGGRMWMEEPPDQRPSNQRAKELVESGKGMIALGCPFCRIMLDAAVPQVTDKEIRLLDLAEMLQDANRAEGV